VTSGWRFLAASLLAIVASTIDDPGCGGVFGKDNYNRCRCHLSLERNSPEPREVERGIGPVLSVAHLGGLHHRYFRAARRPTSAISSLRGPGGALPGPQRQRSSDRFRLFHAAHPPAIVASTTDDPERGWVFGKDTPPHDRTSSLSESQFGVHSALGRYRPSVLLLADDVVHATPRVRY